MPNWVTNRIFVPIAELKPFIIEREAYGEISPALDFNAIIPMPDKLYREGVMGHVQKVAEYNMGLITDEEAAHFRRYKYEHLEERDKPQYYAILESYLATGSFSWYDWSIKNWGTKWNSTEGSVLDDSCFEFLTAWSTPQPIIKKLSEILDREILVEYADEDFGYNVGIYTFDRGELNISEELSETQRGVRLATKLLDRDDFMEDEEDAYYEKGPE